MAHQIASSMVTTRTARLVGRGLQRTVRRDAMAAYGPFILVTCTLGVTVLSTLRALVGA